MVKSASLSSADAEDQQHQQQPAMETVEVIQGYQTAHGVVVPVVMPTMEQDGGAAETERQLVLLYHDDAHDGEISTEREDEEVSRRESN